MRTPFSRLTDVYFLKRILDYYKAVRKIEKEQAKAECRGKRVSVQAAEREKSRLYPRKQTITRSE